MKNKMRKVVLGMLVAMLLILAVPFQCLAAGAKIAFSDPDAQVGQEVSVTMKFTSTSNELLGHTDVMLSYDATMLEYINETENASGGNGAIRVLSGPGISEAVTELRFKALRAGTAKITIASWEGYDNSGGMLTMEHEGTSTITIKGLETSSADATLQSLQISPGVLSPAFTPEQTSYTTTVGLDTDKLTISAYANNDAATVSVQGGNELQEGENTVICKVTAEDGTTVNSYTITVNKIEGGGAEAGAEGSGENGSQAAEPEVLAELEVSAKRVRIISLPDGVEVPEGFKDSSIAIGDKKVNGWTWTGDTDPRYCVFYGMNENGDQDFYRYDLRDKTVQRYFANEQDGSAISPEQYAEVASQYNSLLDDYKICRLILFILIGVAVVLLIALVIVSRKNRVREDAVYGALDDKKPAGNVRAQARESRTSSGRRMTKEERYMRGEEDEYEEEDRLPEQAVAAMKTDGIGLNGMPNRTATERTAAGGTAAVQAAPERLETEAMSAQKRAAVQMLEQALAQNLAADAAVPEQAASVERDNDFEFFDLDDGEL